jgi:hypothetical protein
MPKNFLVFIGRVPPLFSSENRRMVTAGTRNRKTQGAIMKKLSSVAKPPSRIFESPGKIHRKRLLITTKTIMTIYPIKEEKKARTSFKNKILINVKFFI